MNYEIFQFIIEEYDIDRHQERLKYPEHLKAYINKHKLSEFYEINPQLEDFTDTSKKAILKFDIELISSLGNLKARIENVASILKLKPSALRLLGIEEGCVVATLLIPASIADTIFTSDKQFSSEEEDRFRAVSVVWFRCNGCFFYFRHLGKFKMEAVISALFEHYLFLVMCVCRWY